MMKTVPLSGRLMRALKETKGDKARAHLRRILERHEKHPNDPSCERVLTIIREDHPELLAERQEPAVA